MKTNRTVAPKNQEEKRSREERLAFLHPKDRARILAAQAKIDRLREQRRAA